MKRLSITYTDKPLILHDKVLFSIISLIKHVFEKIISNSVLTIKKHHTYTNIFNKKQENILTFLIFVTFLLLLRYTVSNLLQYFFL